MSWPPSVSDLLKMDMKELAKSGLPKRMSGPGSEIGKSIGLWVVATVICFFILPGLGFLVLIIAITQIFKQHKEQVLSDDGMEAFAQSVQQASTFGSSTRTGNVHDLDRSTSVLDNDIAQSFELANQILRQAIQAGASDLQLLKDGDFYLIRQKVDGHWVDLERHELHEGLAVARRLKAMAGINPYVPSSGKESQILLRTAGRHVTAWLTSDQGAAGDLLSIALSTNDQNEI